MVMQVEALRDAGVSALRLSPQSRDFLAIAGIYRARLDGALDGAEATRALESLDPAARLSDGFLTGARGADWSAKARALSA